MKARFLLPRRTGDISLVLHVGPTFILPSACRKSRRPYPHIAVILLPPWTKLRRHDAKDHSSTAGGQQLCIRWWALHFFQAPLNPLFFANQSSTPQTTRKRVLSAEFFLSSFFFVNLELDFWKCSKDSLSSCSRWSSIPFCFGFFFSCQAVWQGGKSTSW